MNRDQENERDPVASDWSVVFAVYATSLVTVLASLVRPLMNASWGQLEWRSTPGLLFTWMAYALWGGSFVLPFAILALRGTQLSRTVPMVAVAVVATSFLVGWVLTPFHAAGACLVSGSVALLFVRILMPRSLPAAD